VYFYFFFQAEDGIRDFHVTGVQTCALPILLTSAGFRTPTRIAVNGFLTVNGAKMSKSRGTFIEARTYLDHLNPEYLRYYYAAKRSEERRVGKECSSRCSA